MSPPLREPRRAPVATESWKVGQLARRTGLTVRALHHYDDIGLLVPSGRTPSGHRLYTRDDVERLQQIQSLRLMGFPLDEVKRLLSGARLSLRRVVDLHLVRLQEQIVMQTRLAGRLSSLSQRLERDHDVTTDALCQMIEAMTSMEKYFTAEQLDTLRIRREEATEQRVREVEREWGELIPAVQHHMNAGTPPDSAEVLVLARRWKALVEEFTGGDVGISKAVMAMYQNEGDVLSRRMSNVPTPAMFEYIGKSYRALADDDA